VRQLNGPIYIICTRKIKYYNKCLCDYYYISYVLNSSDFGTEFFLFFYVKDCSGFQPSNYFSDVLSVTTVFITYIYIYIIYSTQPMYDGSYTTATTELLKSRKSDIQQLAAVNAAGCGNCV